MSSSNTNVDTTVDTTVDTVETNVDTVETKVDTVETKVDTVETKVDTVETKVDTVETKVETKVDTVETKVETKVDTVKTKAKVRYTFTKKSSEETLNDLKSRTDDFKSIRAPTMISNGESKTIDRDRYMDVLLYKINNTKGIYYGVLDAPCDTDTNKKIIGKGGCYFYKTTVENRILFIWHNRENKKYEFWGSSFYGMINSMNAISTRIEKNSE
jgi:outer membrane murein-binding lipoprotein Lpp